MKYKWNKSIKWHPNFIGKYAVTIDGRVASYLRKEPHWLKLHIMKQWSPGYIYVHFFNKNKWEYAKKTHLFFVHILVLETFVSSRPKGLVASHKDNNKANNNLSNLCWDSQRNNILNSPRKSERSSYFGVTFDTYGRTIMRFTRGINDEEKAAELYDMIALFVHGPDTKLNFPKKKKLYDKYITGKKKLY